MDRWDHKCCGRIAFILCSIVIVYLSSGCTGGGSSSPTPTIYSNATFTGTWLIKSITPGQSTYGIYDGNGTISEFGGNMSGSPAGTYQVESTGSFSGVLFSGPQYFAGTINSTTHAVLSNGSEVIKVSDLGACQGTWYGSMTETAPGGSSTFPISFTVDSSGNVTSFTGRGGPVSGKAFSESGKIVAHFVTAEIGYNEFRIDGGISGPDAAGLFKASSLSTNFTGTFSLTKTSIDNTKANGTFAYVVTDATNSFTVDRGTLTFDGAGYGTYASLVSTDSGTFKYTVTIPDNTLTIDDTTIGSINSAGNFFAVGDVTGGSVFMLLGIKHAVSYVDTSATYRGSEYWHNAAALNPSVVTLFSMTTATPPGVLSYSDLTSIQTVTMDYAIASNGTWTANPASPNRFGAISEDKNFMIYGTAAMDLEPNQALGVALKIPDSRMTNASLKGTFMGVEFYDDNAGTGSPAFGLTRFTFTFNGDGSGTYSIIQDSAGYAGSASFTYALSGDGAFMIDGGLYSGTALQDGSVVVFGDDDVGDNYISVGVAIKQ